MGCKTTTGWMITFSGTKTTEIHKTSLVRGGQGEDEPGMQQQLAVVGFPCTARAAQEDFGSASGSESSRD